MAKTPKDLRPKSTEPIGSLERYNREAAEDGKEGGAACYRNEVPAGMYQAERKVINARQSVATGHVAGNQALDRKEMPVMKD